MKTPINQPSLIELVRLGHKNGKLDTVVEIIDDWTNKAVHRIADLESQVKLLREAIYAGLMVIPHYHQAVKMRDALAATEPKEQP